MTTLVFLTHWSSQYFMQCPCTITCTCSSCPYEYHSIGWPTISPSFHWMTTHFTIIPLDDHPSHHHSIGWPPISPSFHWMTTHFAIIPLDDHPFRLHSIGWPPISQSSHWMTTHLTIIQVIPCLHKDINGRPIWTYFDVQ